MEKIQKLVERLSEIRAEMAEIAAADDITEEQEARFDELKLEATGIDAERVALVERAEALDAVTRAANDERNTVERVIPVVNRTKADPYDVDGSERVSEMRSRALDAVEAADTDDAAKAEVVRKLERVDDKRGSIAKLVLATGSDDYQSAFHKILAHRQELLTVDERHALARAEELRAALSLTDANGGYAVPFTLDPTLIVTNAGVADPIRMISTVKTITTDTWNGLSSAGVTASWDGEAAVVSDDSPTVAQPSIKAEKAQAFVQGSIEISQDWQNLSGELSGLFADAKSRLEGAAWITGAGPGSDQPTGIVTALDGGGREVSPATAETFAKADVYATRKHVGPRYRGMGSFVAALGTIDAIRQFGSTDDAFLVDLGGATPQRLLGQNLYEASSMDDADDINAAATADNHILVFGDFSQYYIIDRVGMTVEYIPHVFDPSTGRPTGQRGWYAFWRVGADSVNDNAFAVLNVATTA